MGISNVFVGENTKSPEYSYIGDYPRVQIKVNKIINDVGIHRAKSGYGRGFSDMDLIFDKITLVAYPNIVESVLPAQHGAPLQEFLNKKFMGVKGYTENLSKCYVLKKFQGEVCKSLTSGGVAYGFYYPNRNLILIFFNLFGIQHKKGISPLISIYKAVFKMIKESLSKENIELMIYNTENLQRRKHIMAFAKALKERVASLVSDILKNETLIDKFSREMVVAYQKIRLNHSELKVLKKMIYNFEGDIINNIEGINELHFVKGVDLDNRGIVVDVGDMSHTHEGETTYVGRMGFVIKPDRVLVTNKYPKGGYQHFHVSQEIPCLGTRKEKVSKLIGQFRFKELIFFMYTFLKTYSESESGRPYVKFKDWAEFRKSEGKFDENGKIIKKLAVKI